MGSRVLTKLRIVAVRLSFVTNFVVLCLTYTLIGPVMADPKAEALATVIDAADRLLTATDSVDQNATNIDTYYSARSDLRLALLEALASGEKPHNDLRFVLRHTLARGETWVAKALLQTDGPYAQILPAEVAILEVQRGNIDRVLTLVKGKHRAIRQVVRVAATQVGSEQALALESRIYWATILRGAKTIAMTQRNIADRIELLTEIARSEQDPTRRTAILELIADMASGFEVNSRSGFLEIVRRIAPYLISLGLNDQAMTLVAPIQRKENDRELRELKVVVATARAQYISTADAIGYLGNDLNSLMGLERALRARGETKAADAILTKVAWADADWRERQAKATALAKLGLCKDLRKFVIEEFNWDKQEVFWHIALERTASDGADSVILCMLKLGFGGTTDDVAEQSKRLWDDDNRDRIAVAAIGLAQAGHTKDANEFINAIRRQGQISTEDRQRIDLIQAMTNLKSGELHSALKNVTELSGWIDARKVSQQANLLVGIYRRARTLNNMAIEEKVKAALAAGDRELRRSGSFSDHAVPAWCRLVSEKSSVNSHDLYRLVLLDQVMRTASDDGVDAAQTVLAEDENMGKSEQIKLCIQLLAGDVTEAIRMVRDKIETQNHDRDWMQFGVVLAARL